MIIKTNTSSKTCSYSRILGFILLINLPVFILLLFIFVIGDYSFLNCAECFVFALEIDSFIISLSVAKSKCKTLQKYASTIFLLNLILVLIIIVFLRNILLNASYFFSKSL